tara:strand:- start:509 stop:670 length:162 start_codon:yes stop_codon:yes gene_type:complete
MALSLRGLEIVKVDIKLTISLLKTLTKHGRYKMAGFGFIKERAKKACKKMYGH